MKSYTFISTDFYESWWVKKFYTSIDDLIMENYDNIGGEIIEFTYDENSLPIRTNSWKMSQCNLELMFNIENNINAECTAYSCYSSVVYDDEEDNDDLVVLVEPKRNNLFLP